MTNSDFKNTAKSHGLLLLLGTTTGMYCCQTRSVRLISERLCQTFPVPTTFEAPKT